MHNKRMKTCVLQNSGFWTFVITRFTKTTHDKVNCISATQTTLPNVGQYQVSSTYEDTSIRHVNMKDLSALITSDLLRLNGERERRRGADKKWTTFRGEGGGNTNSIKCTLLYNLLPPLSAFVDGLKKKNCCISRTATMMSSSLYICVQVYVHLSSALRIRQTADIKESIPHTDFQRFNSLSATIIILFISCTDVIKLGHATLISSRSSDRQKWISGFGSTQTTISQNGASNICVKDWPGRLSYKKHAGASYSFSGIFQQLASLKCVALSLKVNYLLFQNETALYLSGWVRTTR